MGGEFEPYGASHLVALAVFAVGVPLVVALGRHVRTDHDQARRTSRSFAGAIVCFTVPLQIVDFMPGRFDIATTLPIQLCDLAWVAAAVALWTHRRTAVALTYYWALVLSTQGLITPSLNRDFPDPKFIAFWGMHLLIVWSAIFLTWGLDLRPSWRGYRTTVTITICWLAAVFGVNAVLGTNYGYVNHKPHVASMLDLLGPWPTYVVAEVLLVAAVWALMTWPWVRADRRVNPLTASR
jgi:hypothetical integral membrane protein (TIGR02206 family)